MSDSVSEITREVDKAFWLIGGVSLVLLTGVTAAMLVFVVKFNRTRAKTTSQIEGHKTLELVWIVLPTAIVLWMFFVGYKGFGIMRRPPSDAMVVEVTGRQWSWAFFYPGEGVSASEMVVPVNTPVRVNLTAPPEDVTHSFYIPDFRVKEDVVPGQDTSLWFESEREGYFNIFCAEFCGKDHSKMISVLRVVSDDDYRKWLREQVLRRYKPLEFEGITDPDHPAFGEEDLNIDAEGIYSAYCASCHGPQGDGSGLPGEARDFREPDGWKIGRKTTDIYRALTEGIEGTRMRPFPNLTPWERVAMAHYVRSFMTEPTEATREDYDALVAQYGLDKVQPPKESIPVEKAIDILVEEAQEARVRPNPGGAG